MSCVYTSVYVGISNWLYNYWHIGEMVICNVGLADICKPQESIVCPDWTWGADVVPNWNEKTRQQLKPCSWKSMRHLVRCGVRLWATQGQQCHAHAFAWRGRRDFGGRAATELDPRRRGRKNVCACFMIVWYSTCGCIDCLPRWFPINPKHLNHDKRPKNHNPTFTSKSFWLANIYARNVDTV